MSPNHNYKILIPLVFLVAIISLVAIFSYVSAQLAEGVTQDQISAALNDLSQIYGEEVATEEQAREICNLDKYVTDCAEIGKKHNLFPPEQIEQVDTLLDEIKGTVAEQIKSCQNIECLVGVAEGLAIRISRKNPEFASQIDLTPTIVREKKEIVEAAKSIGLTIDQCIEMDPDTASVELLRGCARLAKEDQVKKYIPAEARARVDQIVDSNERTVQLKEALSNDQYQCGDNTIDGCGNFCLNQGTEARAQGVSAIPAVCKEIASKFFGSQGVRELESAYSRVSGVADYYYKKAQNFVFTTLDGQTITNPEEIGAYMEAQARAGNVEAVSKGMDFMIAQGFVNPADKDFAIKMVSKFRERGGVDFDNCAQNPKACQDFIHDDFRNDFNVMEQVFDIMSQELGFNPDLCDQGQFDQSIGTKCLEGARRALPKIEALSSQYPEVRFMVEEIRGHIQRGDQLSQRKDDFSQGRFSGPGGCQDERSCFVYCSNPANGPECIAFGAKQGLAGFTGEQAVQKYQQYDYTLRRPAIEEQYIINGGPVYGGPGYPPTTSGYPPYGAPTYGPNSYGPNSYGPYYPPYPTSGPQPGQDQRHEVGDFTYGPNPECVKAISSGDFVRAKEVCNVSIGGPGTLFPTNSPICPASLYIECPAGQFRESYRNNDGCWIDGSCNPIPTYSPGPYPTYSPPPGGGFCGGIAGIPCPTGYICQVDNTSPVADSGGRCVYTGPYPTPPGPGGKPQCSDGIDNDSDGKIDFPADSSCYGPEDFDEYYPTSGGPTYTPYPGDSTACPGFAFSRSDKTGKRYCQLNETRSCEFFYPAYLDRANYSPTECPTEDSPYPTYSPGPGGTSCSKLLISLLGDGCHQMYTDSSGRQVYCDEPMTKSAKEGDTATISGCYGSGGPQPSYSPYPTPGTGSCPAGYHYHGEQGGFCMNEREDYSATCYSADGKTTIKCPTQPTNQCTPPQWWDPAKGYCVGGGSTCTPETCYDAIYCSDGKDNDSDGLIDKADPACGGTSTYTPYPSPGTCPSGYHNHSDSGGFCMNDREDYAGTCYTTDGKSTTTCPKPTYTPGPSYTPPPSCPSGQWWDYQMNKCTSTTSCGTGYYWDSAANICKPSGTATYTPVPSCPSGQWWDYARNACVSTSTTYTPYPSSQACSGGQWWDSAKNACTCSNGYSWDAANNICKSNCASDQWWDSATNSCKSIYASPTYTPYSGYCGDAVCSSSESSSSCPSDCGGGTATTYTPYPTSQYTPPPSCPSGQWWDSASNSCMGSTYPTPSYVTPPYATPPETSPPPPTSGTLYNHLATIHCVGLGRVWDGEYCQPEGFIARAIENTLANLGKLIGF